MLGKAGAQPGRLQGRTCTQANPCPFACSPDARQGAGHWQASLTIWQETYWPCPWVSAGPRAGTASAPEHGARAPNPTERAGHQSRAEFYCGGHKQRHGRCTPPPPGKQTVPKVGLRSAPASTHAPCRPSEGRALERAAGESTQCRGRSPWDAIACPAAGPGTEPSEPGTACAPWGPGLRPSAPPPGRQEMLTPEPPPTALAPAR